MNSASLALAERAAPRYTSYPTARIFPPPSARSRRANGSANFRKRRRSRLFHVPFCAEICAYCGCHTKALRQEAPLTVYKETLLREIELVAGATRPASRRHPLGRRHAGDVGPARFLEISESIARHFDVGAHTEHAIELDPRLLAEPLVEALARAGVNRPVSACRISSPCAGGGRARAAIRDRRRAVELLRRGGVEALNFDLMYGLPHQTREDVARTPRWRRARAGAARGVRLRPRALVQDPSKAD